MSMNPFMLATTLSLATILSRVRHTRGQLITSGLIFILTVWMINFFVLLGSYDHLIYHPLMGKVLVWFYIILAAIFMLVGLVHLRDWWRLRSSKDPTMFSLATPRNVSFDKSVSNFGRLITLCFICVISGWALSLLEARLTQNYYLFIIITRKLGESGNALESILTFIAYMSAYTWTLIFLFGYLIVSGFSMRFKTNVSRFISLEKISCAAVYFSVATGLIYYMLNVVQL